MTRMRHAALFLWMVPLWTVPALAQIQLLQFDGTNETPVGTLYQVAPAAPGDLIETRFRVRNQGSGAVVLQSLSLSGTGFSISAAPSLPYTIAPGSFVDFKTTFAPTSSGSYSANLQVNQIATVLHGVVSAALILSLGSTPLGAGATIPFGAIERDTSTTQTLTLSNPASSALSLSTATVSGTGFSGPVGLSAPLTLSPGQSISFTIQFAPHVPTQQSGTLTLDQRTFALSGQGLEPALPKASISLAAATATSAQQTSVSIQLASPSKTTGTGTLTMAFHPAVIGVANDPAVQFLSGPPRIATVSVLQGDTIARFGTLSQLKFQTGTTSGTIVFTLTMPNSTDTASVTVPAASVTFDTATGSRRTSDLDVSLIGVDNTYSISQLAFTFYDTKGVQLQPGTFRVDVSKDFHSFFTTSPAGGAFAVRATFPVSGDPTKVSGVDVQVTNSVGVTNTQRITF